MRDDLIFLSDSPGNRVHIVDARKGKVKNRSFGRASVD